MFLHPLDFPLISYFVNWRDVAGTYALGFVGLFVCLVFSIICWRQIMTHTD